MFAVWASVSLIRTVTVVDGDIDPWDHVEVEWARTCFARPDRDYLIVPGGPADRAEPLAAPPGEAVARARARLAELG